MKTFIILTASLPEVLWILRCLYISAAQSISGTDCVDVCWSGVVGGTYPVSVLPAVNGGSARPQPREADVSTM